MLREVEEENYFFPPLIVRRPPARPLRGPPRLHPAREPSERDRQPGEVSRSAGRRDQPEGLHLGASRVPLLDLRADDLRLVRRPAELHHGHRIRHGSGSASSRSGRQDVHVIGKDITRFHCAPLARDADVGGPPPAEAGVWARVRVSEGGEKHQQEPGQRRRPDGPDLRVLGRGVPVLFRQPVSVRRRRRVSPTTASPTSTTPRLADNLGNLYSRTLSMAVRYFRGRPRRRLGDRRDGLEIRARPAGIGRELRADRGFRLQRRDPADLVRGARPGQSVYPGDGAVQGREDRPGRRPHASS